MVLQEQKQMENKYLFYVIGFICILTKFFFAHMFNDMCYEGGSML